jgi:hypothetical protein
MHFFEVFTEVVTANRATSDTQTQNTSHPFVVEKVINNSPNKIYSDFPWLFCLTKTGKIMENLPQVQHWLLLHRSQILLAKNLTIRTRQI